MRTWGEVIDKNKMIFRARRKYGMDDGKWKLLGGLSAYSKDGIG